MKKVLSLVFVLVMLLTSIACFAEPADASVYANVYTRFSVNEEVLRDILSNSGMEDDQLGLLDPFAAFFNTLGVRSAVMSDGAEVTLDLNDKELLVVGVETGEDCRVASTLFPNYILTVSGDTISSIINQATAKVPSVDALDIAEVSAVFGKYVTPWFEAVSGAGQLGDPVETEYNLETRGYVFDTMVPVTVDIDVVKDATVKMLKDIVADEDALKMLGDMGLLGQYMSSGEFDKAAFDSDIAKALDEMANTFPTDVSGEFYTVGEEAIPFYFTGKATFEQTDVDTMDFSVFFADETHFGIDCAAGGSTCGIDVNEDTVRFAADDGDSYFGLTLHFQDKHLDADLYVMNREQPVVTISTDFVSGIGDETVAYDRILDLSGEGKTVVAYEDISSGEQADVVEGLSNDIMTNGLPALVDVAMAEVPELASIIGAVTSMATLSEE